MFIFATHNCTDTEPETSNITCNAGTGSDRFTPGHTLPYKWESCFNVQESSWGYDRTGNITDYHNSTSLIYQLVDTVGICIMWNPYH